MAFSPTIQSLSDMVCVNKVLRMVMLGLPYLETYAFGKTPMMSQVQIAEGEAKRRFSRYPTFSKLTIA
jgi:hypothetical protein